MTARKGATTTRRSGLVPTCAKWLMACLPATACLNPWPDEFPQRAPVTESRSPSDNPDPMGIPELDDVPLFPIDPTLDDEGSAPGAGGSPVAPPAAEDEPDAGAPASDAGLTVTNRRLRGLRDAGADAK